VTAGPTVVCQIIESSGEPGHSRERVPRSARFSESPLQRQPGRCSSRAFTPGQTESGRLPERPVDGAAADAQRLAIPATVTSGASYWDRASSGESLAGRLDDLIVVERHNGASLFERPDPARLNDWLADYWLGELWEKNLPGGRPPGAG